MLLHTLLPFRGIHVPPSEQEEVCQYICCLAFGYPEDGQRHTPLRRLAPFWYCARSEAACGWQPGAQEGRGGSKESQPYLHLCLECYDLFVHQRILNHTDYEEVDDELCIDVCAVGSRDPFKKKKPSLGLKYLKLKMQIMINRTICHLP